MDLIRKEAALRAGICAQAIKENLCSFWRTAAKCGMDRSELRAEAEKLFRVFPDRRREEILGMAEGAGCAVADLVAFNAFGPQLQPEGCTVFFAAGKASASGATIHGKNSDKGGDLQLVNERCVNFHEINVVSWIQGAPGDRHG